MERIQHRTDLRRARRRGGFAVAFGAAFFAWTLPAAAQTERCEDPNRFCGDAVSEACVARMGAGLISGGPEPSDDCAQELEAYRACVAVIAPCTDEEATGLVDPALVGVWRMRVPRSTGGLGEWRLEIGVDGAYVFASDDPARQNAVGVMRAAEGHWTVRFRGWEDGGRYRMPSRDIVVFEGRSGDQTWARVPAE